MHYVYGPGGMLPGEYDNSGVLIREYVYVNGEPLAQIDAGSPEVLTYIHTDHLMTPRYGTNAGGSTVWTWDSGAFGKEAPTGSATVNLRFPGQYYDSESTLHYNWNRYYNPAIGRFISSDPIGLEGGLNTFGYAGQSPVVFFDFKGWHHERRPDGRNCVDEDGNPAYCPRNPCATAECAADLPPAQHEQTIPNPPNETAQRCYLQCMPYPCPVITPNFLANTVCGTIIKKICRRICEYNADEETNKLFYDPFSYGRPTSQQLLFNKETKYPMCKARNINNYQ